MRGGERDRDRQTDRQTEKEKQRERVRPAEREIYICLDKIALGVLKSTLWTRWRTRTVFNVQIHLHAYLTMQPPPRPKVWAKAGPPEGPVTFWQAVLYVSARKLQALVYDILPSTTAITDYTMGLEQLSANGQFYTSGQTAVCN